MSIRYLPDRFLPDKAIDIIDEACSSANVRKYVSFGPGKLKYNATTREVEDNTGVKGIPSSKTMITEKDVAEVISLWTDIPVTKLTTEESARLSDMENILKSRVKGQDKSIHKICQVVKMARVGLANPGKPQGVFLFLGPTGVGKTELAKALAEFLFGSEEELIRLDMSEFKEKHSISKLIGSPAGYVGHEDEARFTRMVRAKPYSVVLLDEVEKAHPEVFDIFLQVFDEGRLTDQRGRVINFCNTIIILTSNLAVDYDEILRKVEEEKKQVGDEWSFDEEMIEREKICNKLQEYFRPEFLNRIDEIIVFNPMEQEVLRSIANININSFIKRLKEEKEIALIVEDEVVDLILKYGYNPRYGARPLKRAVQQFLINSFAQKMLENAFRAKDVVVASLRGEKIIFTREGHGEDFDDDFDDEHGDDDSDNDFDRRDDFDRTWGPGR
jgi:ATP-dependent Clp protease ATP-binding subunit ClpA